MGKRADAWEAIVRALCMDRDFFLAEAAKSFDEGTVLGVPVDKEMMRDVLRWSGKCPECGHQKTKTG